MAAVWISKTSTGYDKGLWIAARRNNTDHKIYFKYTGAEVGVELWKPGEPNPNKNCVKHTRWAKDFEMHDCSERKQFMCEKIQV